MTKGKVMQALFGVTHTLEYSDVNCSDVPALHATHDFSKASGQSPASLCITFVIRASWFPGFPEYFQGPPGMARLLHVVFMCSCFPLSLILRVLRFEDAAFWPAIAFWTCQSDWIRRSARRSSQPPLSRQHVHRRLTSSFVR